MPSGGAGRRDRLAREGIRPHQTSDIKPPVSNASTSRRVAAIPNQRASSESITDSYSPSPGRGAAARPRQTSVNTKNKEALGAGKTKVGPWVHRGGSGVFAISQDHAGGNLGGDPNASARPSVLTFEPSDGSGQCVQNGNYTLKMEFKCELVPPACGLTSTMSIILEAKSVDGWSESVSLFVDCVERQWTLEKRDKDGSKVIHTRADRELRPGVWHPLRVEVRGGNTTTVYCGTRSILQSVSVPAGPTGLKGPLGVAVVQSKLTWRDWSVEGASGDYALKHIQGPYQGDDRRYVDLIEQDILDRNLGVTFDDIASLDDAKQLLNEAVTLPLIIPEYFTGIREPWKGVLLFGPPGTGKTLLAKAISANTGVKFFNCSASTLMSKWRGESEKLVKVLFNMARHYAPSIIFFDEADALLSVRGGDGEHEASRRFKSELLSQMDGIPSASGEASQMVMVLATSNCPWDLDEALRRRLEKRIYIPLPDKESRNAMFRIHLSTVNVSEDIDFESLVQQTDGYSGADIKIVCRDASMMPMRRLLSQKKNPEEIRALKEEGGLDVCLVQEDFEAAINKTHPSVSPGDVTKYEEWNETFASI
mmetsp:Transcript_45128/g.84194  ORF Transcript_45128/g.84194 Transcript_45128/m.84194 type:complete len:593 (-) Transcript_45128:114-1892(-)